jgi:PIN domain nuclease of toxin-antitoxin system
MALLKREPGAEQTAAAIRRGAAMSTVNISEVVAKLLESDLAPNIVRTMLDELKIESIPFDNELAHRAGQLRRPTRELGLSFADRACLATAQVRDIPVLTADKAWADLVIGVKVQLIR